MVRSICGALSEKKVENILVLHLKNLTHLTDYFVIGTAQSGRQAQAAGEFLCETLKGRKVLPLGVEGQAQGNWILLDFVDVVVHIFQPRAREYFSLERVWGDAADVSRDFV
jgi:ribosome-associated protein